MPFQKERYPENWKEISLRIREREGWHCKWCGAANNEPHPTTGSKVILTVAHLGTPLPSNQALMELENIVKQCNSCLLLKPLDDFPPDKRNKDGKQGRCRECCNATQREWYANGGKEISIASTREWRERNQERVYEQHREWVANNLEHRREQQRLAYAKWKEANPDLVRAHRQVNKARKRGDNIEGVFTSDEWLNLCAETGWTCVACRQQAELTPDHIVPLALGGCNHITNIQPLCLTCNLKKGTKIIDYRALHDKMDVRDENLAALCQRCHLNYDRDEHKANAARTRERKRRDRGIIPLFDLEAA